MAKKVFSGGKIVGRESFSTLSDPCYGIGTRSVLFFFCFFSGDPRLSSSRTFPETDFGEKIKQIPEETINPMA